ncbi:MULTISPECIES: DinB family protein [unclassified Streptomyces]|uniref:hypothetical protein n=1 Tax=Streptomyces sp. SYP-A7185 TaxID=3040076 RepID=UPI0038F6B20F
MRGAVGSMPREVEAHHTDLATGHRPDRWPALFTAREPETTVARLRTDPHTPTMTLCAEEDQTPRAVGSGRGPGPRVNGPWTSTSP